MRYSLALRSASISCLCSSQSTKASAAVLSVFAAMQPGVILLVAGPFLGERPGVWHVAWMTKRERSRHDTDSVQWMAIIIVFTGGLGHIAMAWVHRYVDASRSSLYLLSMNIVAIVAAWIIHDEPLTAVQILGGVVVFVAVAAVVSRPADRVREPLHL